VENRDTTLYLRLLRLCYVSSHPVPCRFAQGVAGKGKPPKTGRHADSCDYAALHKHILILPLANPVDRKRGLAKLRQTAPSLLSFPFRESASGQNPFLIAFFLDLALSLPKIESRTRRGSEAARSPAGRFVFFDNLAGLFTDE